ncbi:hypothetical protein Lser_V15G16809 [Lactuca serriola]
MIPNIPKYDGKTDPDEHVGTYEWTMTSLWMDKRLTCTNFLVMLSGNASKWFKELRPGSFSNFEQFRYLFLKKFMQLRKMKGDANFIMSCKQKEGESIRVYNERFTLVTLSVPGHEVFLVTCAFTKGLLPGPLSRKMQGTVPKSRDELKYRVEKYPKKIEGEERKEANLKVVANAYLKQESDDSHSHHSHKERHDGSHNKHNRHSGHSTPRFRPFVKDKPRSHRLEVNTVEKTPSTGGKRKREELRIP